MTDDEIYSVLCRKAQNIKMHLQPSVVFEIANRFRELSRRHRARWIEQEDSNLDTYYTCSWCGSDYVLVDGAPEENHYNFCPYCGADMRTEEQREIH